MDKKELKNKSVREIAEAFGISKSLVSRKRADGTLEEYINGFERTINDDLMEIMKRIEDKTGVTCIMGNEIKKYEFVEFLEPMDKILGGGILRGFLIEIYAWEGCLHPDTFIKYSVIKDGRDINIRGGSIRRLYERFHNIKVEGSGKNGNTVKGELTFTVSSINENGRVFKNPIADVVYSGVKECFKVETTSGKTVICTKDHKFFVGDDYVELEKLKVGDTVFAHLNTTVKLPKKEKIGYAELHVKYHPAHRTHLIDGKYLFYRLKKAHAVFEAYKNDMDYKDYIHLLNTGSHAEIDLLWAVPKGMVIHHKDSNKKNDSIENLQLLSSKEHNTYHAEQNDDALRFKVTPTKITSIVPHGEIGTYDIKCFSPYNNFIADGIVVHNCGKTTMCIQIAKEFQKLGKVAWVDTEGSLNEEYAQALGMDTHGLVYPIIDCLEDLRNFVQESAKDFSLIVVDSIFGIPSRAQVESDQNKSTMMDKARVLSDWMKVLLTTLRKNDCTLIFTNQWRVGTFGTYRPGGNAIKYGAGQQINLSEKTNRDEKRKSKTIVAQIDKNKLARPYLKANLLLKWGAGFSTNPHKSEES